MAIFNCDVQKPLFTFGDGNSQSLLGKRKKEELVNTAATFENISHHLCFLSQSVHVLVRTSPLYNFGKEKLHTDGGMAKN